MDSHSKKRTEARTWKQVPSISCRFVSLSAVIIELIYEGEAIIGLAGQPKLPASGWLLTPVG